MVARSDDVDKGDSADFYLSYSLAIVEFRMVIAHLIWNFDMKLREESKDWIDQKVFLIWDKGDLLVELEARETKAR